LKEGGGTMRCFGIFVSVVLAVVSAADDYCRPIIFYPDGSVWRFNLGSLSKDAKGSFMVLEDDNAFFVNICGETTAKSMDGCKGASVCQQTLSGNFNNIGNLSSQKFEIAQGIDPGLGIVVTYTGTTLCRSGGFSSTSITLVCNQTAAEPKIEEIKSDNGCHFSTRITTKRACGKQIADNFCQPLFTNADGSFFKYDLTSFFHNKSTNDTLTSSLYTDQFYFNFCGETSSGSSGRCMGSSACIKRFIDDNYLSAGLLKTQKFHLIDKSDPTKGIAVTYSGGSSDNCYGGSRSSTIQVICDPDRSNPDIDSWVEEVSTCKYSLNCRSKHGCPVSVSFNDTSSDSDSENDSDSGDGSNNLSYPSSDGRIDASLSLFILLFSFLRPF